MDGNESTPYMIVRRSIGHTDIYIAINLLDHMCVGAALTRDDALASMVEQTHNRKLICSRCGGHGRIYDWIENPEEGEIPCPKCSSINTKGSDNGGDRHAKGV